MKPWWRLLRRESFAGQAFVHAQEVNRAAADGTRRLQYPGQAVGVGPTGAHPRKRGRAFVYAFKEFSTIEV